MAGSTEQYAPLPDDQPPAANAAFPQTQDEFDDDSRVSYSKLERKWILEDDDGQEYEWNETVQKWSPVFDDALREQQQQAYASREDTLNDEDNGGLAQSAAKKRKGSNSQPGGTSKKTKHPPQEQQNTAVYATSIPLDATPDEVASVFGKYGLVAESTDNSQKRISMHKDKQTGQFKGDATIVYFRPESVSLAIQMLDDSDFRLGVQGPEGTMRVSEADRSFKKQKDDVVVKDEGDNLFRTKHPDQKRKQMKAKTQKMNNKLADWSSDEEPSALPQINPRFDKLVVLRHMFTLDELASDPKAAREIREDIQEEAETLGRVEDVTLFDKEPDGIASVRFMDNRAADECVKKMNGRHFDGRTVIASLASDTQQYKKAGPPTTEDAKDDEEAERLGQFEEWLESQK